jgi:hypothetical protein
VLILLLVVGLLILGAIGLLARAVTRLAHTISATETTSHDQHVSVVDLLRSSTQHLVRESQITRGYIGHELLEKRVLPAIGFREPESEVSQWRVKAWTEPADKTQPSQS